MGRPAGWVALRRLIYLGTIPFPSTALPTSPCSLKCGFKCMRAHEVKLERRPLGAMPEDAHKAIPYMDPL